MQKQKIRRAEFPQTCKPISVFVCVLTHSGRLRWTPELPECWWLLGRPWRGELWFWPGLQHPPEAHCLHTSQLLHQLDEQCEKHFPFFIMLYIKGLNLKRGWLLIFFCPRALPCRLWPTTDEAVQFLQSAIGFNMIHEVHPFYLRSKVKRCLVQ